MSEYTIRLPPASERHKTPRDRATAPHPSLTAAVAIPGDQGASEDRFSGRSGFQFPRGLRVSTFSGGIIFGNFPTLSLLGVSILSPLGVSFPGVFLLGDAIESHPGILLASNFDRLYFQYVTNTAAAACGLTGAPAGTYSYAHTWYLYALTGLD